MNLRDLKYFLAVAQYNHFGKAAKVNFVSQPALSMQLKKLEEELGVQLFERGNKHVVTTEVAKKLLKHAETIIHLTKEMQEIAKTMQNPFIGDIIIGAFPTIAPYLLPRIIPHVVAEYPKLKMYLVEEKTDILILKLLHGEIDGCFLALPVENNDLETVMLFQDDFFLAVPANHPLAIKNRVQKEDLQEEKLLLLEDGHCLRNQALEICSHMGVKENLAFQATSMETLIQMVAAEVGLTLVPHIAIQKNKNITYIPFSNPVPARKIGLVWRKTSTREACFKKIADIVKSHYPMG